MKKLIALLAVLGFVPYAHAAEGVDATHSGEYRLQYVNNENKDGDKDAFDSPSQNIHQRLRWGTTVRAGEKLGGHFTLVHNADWGSNADQTPDTVVDGSGNPSTNNLLIVNEAYATWMASDAWAIKFGRGSITMGDGRFVSANDFEPVAKAFDGVLASWDQEWARMNFFGVTGAKGTLTAGDTDNTFGRFYGVSAEVKVLPEWLKSANVHVVEVLRDNGEYDLGAAGLVNLGKQENMKIGVAVAGDAAGVDYRVNYEMEKGEDTAYNTDTKTDIKTSMIDAEAGYVVAAAMNTRFHVGYHTDSGTAAGTTDDEQYDGFHYDTHNNGGLMGLFTWGNLTYMRVGAAMSPADDITVGAEYFMFTQTEKDGTTADPGFGGTLDAGAADEDDLGTELDLTVSKKYTNNFNISASYRMFSPGKEYSTDDAFNQLYVESKLTF